MCTSWKRANTEKHPRARTYILRSERKGRCICSHAFFRHHHVSLNKTFVKFEGEKNLLRSKMSSGVVQAVFEQLSLRDNLDLWMSEDESRFEERVGYLAAFPEADFGGSVAACRERAAKNEALAAAFAGKGAEMAEGDLEKGLRCLDKAVTLAAPEGEAVCKALSARAAANLAFRKFGRALQDVEEVERQGGEVTTELTMTKCRALVGMKERALAEKCLEALKEKADNEADLKVLEEDIIDLPTNDAPPTGKGGGREAKLGFSRKVVVREEEGRGRFLVASEALSPGELLAADSPGAMRLLERGREGGHCWHCLATVAAGGAVPCQGCSAVVFCCGGCRGEAEETYHK